MAGDNGNMGTSYQKDNLGSIHNEDTNGEAPSNTGIGKKIGYGLLGIVLIAAIGLIGSRSGKSSAELNSMKTNIEVAKSGLSTKANGELKLFDSLNRYVMEDYDSRSAFASFLPGVAGYFGKPVWMFYINRGQTVASFGTKSKDYPILEFNAANKAYEVTSTAGFRTFIRGTRGGDETGAVTSATSKSSFNIEPFAPATARNPANPNDDPNKPKRILFVGTNDVEIKEIDAYHGITTDVNYFILPEEEFPALVRRTTITNTGEDKITLDVLDGLARIEPAGGKLDWNLKQMGRTLEGWFGVYHYTDDNGDGKNDDDVLEYQKKKVDLTMPFYKMSTEPSDGASVKIELEGHYCLSFIESSDNSSQPLLPIVYDTTKVFGQTTSLDHPSGLDASSVEDILESAQYGWAKTSSAFAAVNQITLEAGESFTVNSVFGKAKSINDLPERAEIVTAPNYIKNKFERARSLINELTSSVETNTVQKLFDGAVKQMFLDNSLRGGLPTILGDADGDKTYDEDDSVKVFHTFSRIHGDLERDYNAFEIQPSYFSQGPGNYRDIAQNRRDDVTFTPRVGAFDVLQFLSFIQADGYEPLTVEAVVYVFENKEDAHKVAQKVTGDPTSEKVLTEVLAGGPFRPGQLFDLTKMLNITITVDNDEFVNTVLGAAEDRAMAVYGTGYWGDHWDYYIDLIESYLAVFPDGEEATMYDRDLRYFFSTATVKPRSQKYVLTLTYDASGKHVLQLDATYFDGDKAAEQEAFRDQNSGLLGIEASWQRTKEGQTYKSSPIAKLFLLGAIKFATRDSYGMGIEYEGGRPGWLDSMNGLPGMVGSGMPETYELYLLLKYVKKVVDKYDREVVIPSELNAMIETVSSALDDLDASGYTDPEGEYPQDVPDDLFKYWDTVTSARENYRNNVQYYFSGNTTSFTGKEVSDIVGRWLTEIEKGMERAKFFATRGFEDDGTSGIPACFFSYDVTDYEENGLKTDNGLPLVNAKAMRVGVFPLFLEGPVRYMKTIQDDPEQLEDLYGRVKESGLRDDELKMYFLSGSLQGQSYDMGRQIAFAPGWLENQSIWMHMSYKYYLQLLRGKLYDIFFDEMKGGGILPFMDPKVYGRSLMECSSFIASSAFPDPSIHGEGFVARLSGSTAEFLSMWKLMFIGPNLVTVNEETNGIEMQLVPALPSWMFDDDSSDSDPTFDDEGNYVVNFKLFAAIEVVYHNPGAKNLYGIPPVKYTVTMKDGTAHDVDGPVIPTPLAESIRRVTSVESIDAYF